jgi:hypothetical protein
MKPQFELLPLSKPRETHREAGAEQGDPAQENSRVFQFQ